MTAQSWNVADKAVVSPPGVHLPFTAPLLSGARGRVGKQGIDYILPNPSGGRGAYVAAWRMVNELAAPTLHDTILARRLQALPVLTPLSARGLARAVAAEGYAGRPSADAAARAQAAIEAETLRCWAMLLMALIQRSDIPEREHARVLAGLGTAGPGVITDGFATLAQRLGWAPPVLSEGLEQVAAAFVPLAENRRIRRLLAMLRSMHAGVGDEQAQQADQGTRALASLERTISTMEHCIGRTEALLGEGDLLLQDPAMVLSRWRNQRLAALAPAVAVEELLDGWDRICLLWLDAATLSARIAILPEVALLVRLTLSAGVEAAGPAASGTGGPSAGSASGMPAPASPPEPGPAGQSPLMLVERNERIRALELALDFGNG